MPDVQTSRSSSPSSAYHHSPACSTSSLFPSKRTPNFGHLLPDERCEPLNPLVRYREEKGNCGIEPHTFPEGESPSEVIKSMLRVRAKYAPVDMYTRADRGECEIMRRGRGSRAREGGTRGNKAKVTKRECRTAERVERASIAELTRFLG